MQFRKQLYALAALALAFAAASQVSAQPRARPLVASRAMAMHERVKAQLPPNDRATANAVVAYVRQTLKRSHQPVSPPAVAAVIQDALPGLTQSQSTELTQYVVDDLGDQIDSMNEVSEMTSLRLQMAMDRMSKLMQTLSNIEKKESDTDSAVIQNLK